MEIIYRTDITPDIDQIIDVYNSSGINRPTTDKERIAKMYDNSNLIATAWDNDKLVGISRSLTDFYYCCYLSDLAVRKDYQASGIGQEMKLANRQRYCFFLHRQQWTIIRKLASKK